MKSIMRPIEKREQDLIQYLVRLAQDAGGLLAVKELFFVEEMDDGGMGSLRISNRLNANSTRKFGRALVEAKFCDSDQILVSIVLNIDTNGEPYELDFWKVDFSPLQTFPSPRELEEIKLI